MAEMLLLLPLENLQKRTIMWCLKHKQCIKLLIQVKISLNRHSNIYSVIRQGSFIYKAFFIHKGRVKGLYREVKNDTIGKEKNKRYDLYRNKNIYSIGPDRPK